MSKKILNVVVQVVVMAVMYCVVMWLLNGIFDHEWAFTYRLLLQGLVFAILYVPASIRMSRGKTEE